MAERRIACRCGTVELAVEGEPFLAVACHCDDCQAGGRQLEALPGAPKVLGPGEGTDYLLVRRDRARVRKGAERLEDHKLKPDSGTRRVVASCCGTPMYADVGPAHWISAYRDRFGSDAPPIEMRVMTRFAPEGSLPDDGLPRHPKASARFVGRIAAAWIPMLLRPGRPRLGWPPAERA